MNTKRRREKYADEPLRNSSSCEELKGPSRLGVLKTWRRYLPKILKVLSETFDGCKYYLVGSAVKGEFWAGSDVDLLVICNERPSLLKVADAVVKLEEEGVPRIFQIHVGDEKTLSRYKRLGPVVELRQLKRLKGP